MSCWYDEEGCEVGGERSCKMMELSPSIQDGSDTAVLGMGGEGGMDGMINTEDPTGCIYKGVGPAKM